MMRSNRAQSVLATLCILCLAGCSQPSAPDVSTKTGQRDGRKRALLVGCTKYDNVPGAKLEGRANDVVLVRTFLKGRFGFAETDIVTLSEAVGGERRPTRAHIMRELDR